MNSYAAYLGHQPHISIAELAAVVPGFTVKKQIEKKILIFESSKQLDPDLLMFLGGTISLSERLSNDDLSIEDVPQALCTETSKVKKKITFGLRTHGMSPASVKTLYRKCKDALKKKDRPSRYVGTPNKPAASVLLHDSGMLDGSQGCEITIILAENLCWIGKTIAAQDIDDYSFRDMEKPVRDTKAGFLPPKLAQVLLNLGQWVCEEEEPLILDPFCGTGVIPMEALLRQWPVLASDSAAKAISGTEKNLEWLRKEYEILKKDAASTVWKHDARKAFDLKEYPDVIVTETHLGPTLNSVPTVAEATKIRNENETLQAEFLKNVADSLPGVAIVCTWPVWKTKTKMLYLEKIWKVLEGLPFEIVSPYDEIQKHERPTLLYRRPEQFVGREIVILKPMQ
ncbi:MAG: RsmD family RNA methyltransferase [bacterium]|nr:RsmD family RNA methyltransferase [bacterium]